MAYVDTATFINNPATGGPFLQRVTVAVGKAAVDVRAEDPATQNHEARMRWATQALQQTDQMAFTMRWGVVSNATIAAAIQANPANPAISDGDLQFVVNSLVDTFAE
jgi:hypothetical protein